LDAAPIATTGGVTLMPRNAASASRRLHRQLYAELGILPDVGGGRVCIKSTGIVAAFIADRFFVGEGIVSLAMDMGTTERAIQQAVRLTANARRQHRSNEVVFRAWQRSVEASR